MIGRYIKIQDLIEELCGVQENALSAPASQDAEERERKERHIRSWFQAVNTILLDVREEAKDVG